MRGDVAAREIVRRRSPPLAIFGVHARELGTQQDDLRGVVDPHEQHHDRPRRAVTRRNSRMPEIEPDQEFPDGEENRRHEGADPHVTPGQAHIGEQAIDQPEQQRHDGQRHDHVDHLQEHGAAHHGALNSRRQGGQRGADEERHE